VVLSWLAKNWASAVSDDEEVSTLKCFTECRIGGIATTFRAHPNYQDRGPWYNWALVSFGTEKDRQCVPCQVLLFYYDPSAEAKSQSSSHDDSDEDASVPESGVMALVQACDYQESMGSTTDERRKKLYKTNLVSRWSLSSARGTTEAFACTPNVPRLYSVPIEAIVDNVIVIKEEPGLCESWHGKKCVWLTKDHRTEWADMYYPREQQEN